MKSIHSTKYINFKTYFQQQLLNKDRKGIKLRYKILRRQTHFDQGLYIQNPILSEISTLNVLKSNAG